MDKLKKEAIITAIKIINENAGAVISPSELVNLVKEQVSDLEIGWLIVWRKNEENHGFKTVIFFMGWKDLKTSKRVCYCCKTVKLKNENTKVTT